MLNLFFVVVAASATSAYKILFVPVQFRSLIHTQLRLGDELIARGHEVYIAIDSRFPEPDKMISASGIIPLPFRVPDDVLFMVSEDFERRLGASMFRSSSGDGETVGELLGECFRSIDVQCEQTLLDDEFFAAARAIKFDLVVVDALGYTACQAILPHRLGVPFASIWFGTTPWIARIPMSPAVTFLPFDAQVPPRAGHKRLTFWERFANLVRFVAPERGLLFAGSLNTTLLLRHAPEFGSWEELLRRSVLLISDRDHHFGNVFPTMPNAINAPGLTTKPAKPLPSELEQIMTDSGDAGVIVVSFGSTAQFLPADVVRKFFDAFATLRQTIVMRFTTEVVVPANVKLFKWMPQNDILGHPKTRLFITHCGNNGLHEALHHAVPIIGFPLFFPDQMANGQMAVGQGFGLVMDIHRFTATLLRANIEEVLDNPKYRSAIERMSAIWHDQPETPAARASFWIEHVIKFGGDHLRPASMDMSLAEFLMFDVVVVVCLFAFVGVLALVGAIVYVWNRCCRRATKKVKKQ